MCRYLECKLTDWKDNQNSQVAELVYALVSTQKSVEWGKLEDTLQTRVMGDYIFKSIQVRILS